MSFALRLKLANKHLMAYATVAAWDSVPRDKALVKVMARVPDKVKAKVLARADVVNETMAIAPTFPKSLPTRNARS